MEGTADVFLMLPQRLESKLILDSVLWEQEGLPCLSSPCPRMSLEVSFRKSELEIRCYVVSS